MVVWDAVKEVHVVLFVFGSLHPLDDAEIFNGGFTVSDIKHVVEPDVVLVVFPVTGRKEFRLQGHVKQQPCNFLVAGGPRVRDIAVRVLDIYVS